MNTTNRRRTAVRPFLLRRAPFLAAAMLLAAPSAIGAQVPRTVLTVTEARAVARRVSPDLRAARAAVAAADASARQAGALANPTFAYTHERASRDGAVNSQHIAALEQPLDVLGQRSARRDAARFESAAARARLDLATAQLDRAVVEAFARLVASDRKAALSRDMAEAFDRATRVSGTRLTAGDVSGYANRRMQLEAARYASLAVEAGLSLNSARLALGAFLADSGLAGAIAGIDELGFEVPALDSVARIAAPRPALATSGDSLRAIALVSRPEIRLAMALRDAARAGIRLARTERLPVPRLSAGIKSERTAAGEEFFGLVAGVALPLPLWDRREGAVAAAEFDVQAREAELAAVRRRVAREVAQAAAAVQAVDAQLAALLPRVIEDTDAALRAVRTAYAEGEITLVEWLDAVRAYQEARSTVADLQAESIVRQAALERAAGLPLSQD